MNITFKSNIGKFSYSIVAKIEPGVFRDYEDLDENGKIVVDEPLKAMVEKVIALSKQGIANTAFRAVASEVEKALVKAGLMTKDAKRDSVAYTAQAAETIRVAAQAKLDSLSAKEGLPSMVIEVTGEHVFGITAPGKEALKSAEEFMKLGQVTVDKVVKKIASTCGYEFPEEVGVEDLARGITALNRFLAAKVAAEAKATLLLDEEETKETEAKVAESLEAGE